MTFSILTVVKNGYPNIKLTITSIKKQSFQNYEHIIVDGLSTDGTSEFIKKNKNKKIKYFRQGDKSLYYALNKAVKLAKNEYIIVLHSGDFFFSSKTLLNLKKIILKNQDIDFFYSNIIYFNNSYNKVLRYWRYKETKNLFTFLTIPHTSLCIKTKIAQKLNYDTQYILSADTKYTLNLCKNFTSKYINQIMTCMKIGGMSTGIKYILIKIKEDLKILYDEFKFFFIIVYLFKILIKVKSFIFFKKKFLSNFNLKIKKLFFFKNY